MTSSTYLALLFGSYIFAVSLPMIWNQKRLVSLIHDFIDSPPLIFLTGVLALAGGISVICFHNIWTADWRSFITIFGWGAAIEGLMLIIIPSPLLRFAKSVLSKSGLVLILGFAYLMLGAYLISRGFL